MNIIILCNTHTQAPKYIGRAMDHTGFIRQAEQAGVTSWKRLYCCAKNRRFLHCILGGGKLKIQWGGTGVGKGQGTTTDNGERDEAWET